MRRNNSFVGDSTIRRRLRRIHEIRSTAVVREDSPDVGARPIPDELYSHGSGMGETISLLDRTVVRGLNQTSQSSRFYRGRLAATFSSQKRCDLKEGNMR